MLPGPEAFIDFSIVVTYAYRAAQGVCQSSTSHICTMTGQTPLMVREGGVIFAPHHGSRRSCCRVRARSTSPLLYAECTSAITCGKALHVPPVQAVQVYLYDRKT